MFNFNLTKKYENVIKLILSLALPFIVGAIGSMFTVSSIASWYDFLNKPWFTPPGWVFGPAWSLLYILIGISFYLIWKRGIKTAQAKIAVGIFSLQIFFNGLWSILFFGLQSPILGLINILVLWLLILINIIQFYKLDKRAGLLLIPYICWVTFATLLNYFVWILN